MSKITPAAAPGSIRPMGHDREPLSSLLLYKFFRGCIVNPFFYTYFRGRVHGCEHVPQTGRVLVVANHGSNLDPWIVGSAVNRPVAFMAKQELFEIPGLKQLITLYGAYPVKRGSADRAAMKAAIASVENGWATGLFLDGTRTPDGRIHDPKLGAAWIAAKTQAAILPVCLWGSDRMFVKGSKQPKSVPLTIRIAPVIAPPASTQRADLEAVTQQCATLLNALHDLGR